MKINTQFVTQLHKGDASMKNVKAAEHNPDHCNITFALRPHSIYRFASKAEGQES